MGRLTASVLGLCGFPRSVWFSLCVMQDGKISGLIQKGSSGSLRLTLNKDGRTEESKQNSGEKFGLGELKLP